MIPFIKKSPIANNTSSTGFNFTASDLTLGETVSTTQGNLSEDAASNANVYRLSWHFYKGETSDPVQRFEYQKCDTAAGDSCADMPLTVIFEAEQSALLDYLIFSDGTGSCCYIKTAESQATITPNMSIAGTFSECEALPDRCLDQAAG